MGIPADGAYGVERGGSKGVKEGGPDWPGSPAHPQRRRGYAEGALGLAVGEGVPLGPYQQPSGAEAGVGVERPAPR